MSYFRPGNRRFPRGWAGVIFPDADGIYGGIFDPATNRVELQ
jgi:hypothetical protein